jgi:hypothetical protein
MFHFLMRRLIPWKPAISTAFLIISVLAFSHWRYLAGFTTAELKWQQRWRERDLFDAKSLEQGQRKAREEEQRRQGEIDAIREKAEQELAVVKADVNSARAAADRLHDKSAQLARSLASCERACHTKTAGTSPPNGNSAIILAELFRLADERAGILAEYADNARARGLACEAAYDALCQK